MTWGALRFQALVDLPELEQPFEVFGMVLDDQLCLTDQNVPVLRFSDVCVTTSFCHAKLVHVTTPVI